MTRTFSVEPYTPNDHAACLRIFDSNTPRFFTREERSAFAAFLDALPGPFWVVHGQPDGDVIGCGGVSVTDEGRSAWLRWGMVAAEHHRQGIGQRLLETRLRWIATQPMVETIRVATTGAVSPFFARMGFEVVQVIEGYYGPGMARYDLELRRRPRERPR
ncbi:MAG: GNAT family N-acetyltransferase [Chloroflexota bacterium]|nr:GNAT family N-acetyltransferase [Chloroflexota bacterium]